MNGKERTLIGVVRVRGIWGVKPKIRTTLEKLRLNRVNHCVIVDDRPQYLGMLNVCKDYVAYGPVSESVVRKLVAKRGRKAGNKRLTEEEVNQVVEAILNGDRKKLKKMGVKPVFRLRPPRKGYKSIKHAYPKGALGKWPSLDELLARMI